MYFKWGDGEILFRGYTSGYDLLCYFLGNRLDINLAVAHLKAIDLEYTSLRYKPNIPPPSGEIWAGGGRRAGAMEKLLHGENLGSLQE